MGDLIVLSVCYCTEKDGPHIHVPVLRDAQYGLTVEVSAPPREPVPAPSAPASATETGPDLDRMSLEEIRADQRDHPERWTTLGPATEPERAPAVEAPWKPRPADLVGAMHDRVHRDTGRSRPATIAAPVAAPTPLTCNDCARFHGESRFTRCTNVTASYRECSLFELRAVLSAPSAPEREDDHG